LFATSLAFVAFLHRLIDNQNMNWKTLNNQLIAQLKKEGAIRSKAVERAFRITPRHLFVPHEPLESAYQNHVIGLKLNERGVTISSLSQPSMIAIMLEQLALQRGQRVLEIGAGTGYNAALMAAIVGEEGRVITLDIDEDLVEMAQANLAAAGVKNVLAVVRDGAFGYVEEAPYDRIILTTSANDIASAWVEQLVDGGRLLLPLIIGPDMQYSIAFDKEGDWLKSDSHYRCRFVTLRGALRTPDYSRVYLNPNTYFSGAAVQDLPIALDDLRAWFKQPQKTYASPIQTTFHAISYGLELWLLTRLPHTYFLLCDQDPPTFEPLMVFQNPLQFGTLAHVNAKGMATLSRAAKRDNELAPLRIHHYGLHPTAAKAMWDAVQLWDAIGQPTEQDVRFALTPHIPELPQETTTILLKKNFNLILQWHIKKN